MYLLIALLVSHPSLIDRPAAQRSDSTLLRVLAINDFHGALEPRAWPWSGGREVGGAAALKPWLDSLARACRCATVRRSEEHTSELQSPCNLVCRLLLEKKKRTKDYQYA